ncbi:hypothetical protein F0P96_07225 [Hymenobacter busanensis]|uniref:Uncharacterized protein n=1 Tax=Hymenobacter busanensis TaxID=2607656 RepID=A0A7L5A398_9BACT|nr:hypothetical protein [Hymenobacter busanensis]KAA9338609.1 hypothetical protein F0P96_07225 [Hymenobacter busanensis]QHJ08962.1 hypothetical protein GUY19_17375 [Hymenobacter busanensis]
MHITTWLLAAATVATLTTCRKVDFGPDPSIAYRDQRNVPFGGDDSDWKADGDWKKVERKLFDDLSVQVDGAGAGGYRSMSLFPNPIAPAERRATLYTNLQNANPLHLRLVMVDKKYRKVATQSAEVTPNSRNDYKLVLDFPADKFKQDELYRIYYVFYDDQGLRFKGHGDFLIKDQ